MLIKQAQNMPKVKNAMQTPGAESRQSKLNHRNLITTCSLRHELCEE